MTINRLSHYCSALVLLTVSCGACADKPSPEADNAQSEAMVLQAIVRNKLTGRSADCLKLERGMEDAKTFDIVVREKHDSHCGGDPDTEPRLFTVRIDRKNYSLSTDARSDEDEFESLPR
jgi:hypothetical protein